MDQLEWFNLVLNFVGVLGLVALIFEMRKIGRVIGSVIGVVSSIPESMSKQRFSVQAYEDPTERRPPRGTQ